jgi:hypothetical protein
MAESRPFHRAFLGQKRGCFAGDSGTSSWRKQSAASGPKQQLIEILLSWPNRIGAIIQVFTGQTKSSHSVPDTGSKLATCASFLLSASSTNVRVVTGYGLMTPKEKSFKDERLENNQRTARFSHCQN